MICNARFWVWYGEGYVKLTLRPGQTVRVTRYGRTEEGWHSESEAWHFDGRFVVSAWEEDGRDCDGRSGHNSITRCHVMRLTALDPVDPGCPRRPDWVEVKSGCYDEFAEAMGY